MPDPFPVNHGQGIDVIDISRGDADPRQEPFVMRRFFQMRLDGFGGIYALEVGKVLALLQAIDKVGENFFSFADDNAVKSGKFRGQFRVGNWMVPAQANMSIGIYLPYELRHLAHVNQTDGKTGDADDIRLYLLQVFFDFLIRKPLGDTVLEKKLMPGSVRFQVT